MKYGCVVALLMLASVAYAKDRHVDDCRVIEYAELKAMPVAKLQRTYCEYMAAYKEDSDRYARLAAVGSDPDDLEQALQCLREAGRVADELFARKEVPVPCGAAK